MTVHESRPDNSSAERLGQHDDEKVKRTKLITLTVAVMAFIGVLWLLVLPAQLERIRRQLNESPSHFIAPDAAERESLKEVLTEAKEQAASLTDAMKSEAQVTDEPTLDTDYLNEQSAGPTADAASEDILKEERLPTEQP